MPFVILCVGVTFLMCCLSYIGVGWKILIVCTVWSTSVSIWLIMRIRKLEKRIDRLESSNEAGKHRD